MKEKKFICICGKKYISGNSLKNHIEFFKAWEPKEDHRRLTNTINP